MDYKRQKNIANAQAIFLRSEDTERAVIGTILRYNELYFQNSDILLADMFHDEYRLLFAAIKKLLDGGEAATPVTVATLVNDGGNRGDRLEIQRMVALSDKDTFLHNVKKLSDYHKRNMARLYFQQCAEDAVKMSIPLDETVSNGQGNINKLVGESGTDSIVSAAEAMRMMREHVMEVREDKIRPGILTGYRIFDSNYGMHEDDLIIIAAHTGVGKSALAMNIAVNVAKVGTGVAYYSAEMGVKQLWARVLSYDMKMRSLAILHDKMSDMEMDKFAQVTDNFAKYPLYIDERASINFDRMLRSMRTMSQQYGVKVFVVDYMQIVRTSKNFDSETLRLAFIARELKNIALELHGVVIVLSQLNRGGVKDGVISKFALRGSGEIEEAADTIVMIDRPDADPNTKGKKFSSGNFNWVEDTTNKAMFILHKGRSTGGAEFLVDFIPEYTLFVDNVSGGYNTAYEGFNKEDMPFDMQTNNEQPF